MVRKLTLILACAVLPPLGYLVISLVLTLVEPWTSTPERVRSHPSMPRSLTVGKLNMNWDGIPTELSVEGANREQRSNIHPEDYAGPQKCAGCHRENYEDWCSHPHRWMNAVADNISVKGDFTGQSIAYLGGNARFYRHGPEYRMALSRDGINREYRINQTIGSRFFQYYVGKGISGPEADNHGFYHDDHVLPFGYWLAEREWVPVVHVEDEKPDGERWDPFGLESSPVRGGAYAPYAESCNYCHTTFPLADMFYRAPRLPGAHAPVELFWSSADYLANTHPALLPSPDQPREATGEEIHQVFESMRKLKAPEHAVTLGISCEACHLGAKAHAEGKLQRPAFLPRSPHLALRTALDQQVETGRSKANANWICSRCHTGKRPTFAARMSTWNSVEFSDALLGSCYSQLACIDCHNPHKATGTRWRQSPDDDDASCLRCHDHLEAAELRVAHTHHPMGSEGARCMNCHMPRLNEGLQDVVRTHMIFSPTRPSMIQSGHPNACNQCHTDKPIDWTLGYLKQWYGAGFMESEIAQNYRDRDQPAVMNWLSSDNEAVRLVAADSLFRTNATWSLNELVDQLDDPFLINRQFARRGLEQMLGVRLEDFGYRFYMTPQQRGEPLRKIRAKLLPNSVATEEGRDGNTPK